MVLIAEFCRLGKNISPMKKGTNFLLSMFSLVFFLSLDAFPEGSKEIYVGTKNTSLFLCNDFVGHCNSGGAGDRTQFCVYGCEETSRLYFVTANNHEIIYIGFNVSDIPASCHGVFRIKNIAGTVVYNQAAIPVSGTGFINTITEARNGPFQIYGAGGYSAINWHPPAPATYYIEFQEVNNSTGNIQTDNNGFNLDLFDLTVYDSVAHLTKTGRLYSKAWQLFENNTHYSGTNYVYSVDSIITSAAFNDMKGGHWVQFCNQWGCANTGNFISDRKSLDNQQAYMPEYLEFLNPPDPLLFPPGLVLGQIVPPNPWGERNCNDGTIIFHVNVNKAGNVEIDLTFPAPYTTRVLTAVVNTGEDLIPWDGKDGSGTNVPNNVLVTFSVKYVNGLTNLPLYDVEGNPNGFTVDIVAPTGATPLVYWDDSNIPGGGTNLVGCSSPPGGCHAWSTPFGDLNTVNTWWYNVSSTTVPISLLQWRMPQALTFNQIPPQTYCAGTNGIFFSVAAEPNTEQYHWSYTGTGATIIQTNLSDPFITVNFAANATSGSIQVYGTNFNCTTFTGPISSLPVTIKPLPVADPPLAKSICSGTNTGIILTSTPAGALFSWTTPSPTCTANIVTCPAGSVNATQINDVLSVNNLIPGSVTYHLTGTLNGCTGPQTNYVVTVNPIPNVIIIAGTPAICSGEAATIQLSSAVPSTTFSWTATGSSPAVTGFGSGAGNLISQVLVVTGFSTQTVTYQVTPSVNGCSPSTPTTYIVTVYPLPNLSNSPASKTICSGEPTNVPLTSNVAGTMFTWTCTPGSANVTGYSDVTIPSAFLNQVLINTGIATETVTYHMTPHANGCDGPVSDYVVSVSPSPDVYFNPVSQVICTSQFCNIQVLSHVPGTTFTWTATGSSPQVTGFSAGAGSLIKQALTNSGSSIETVTYHVYPEVNGCPLTTPTDVTVTVNPEPAVTNSVKVFQQCSGTVTGINLTSDVTGTTFTWMASGSSPQVSGYSNGAGPSILQTLSNSGFNIESVTYLVVPAANGCTGSSVTFTVTVFPVPDVWFTPVSQAICPLQITGITNNSNVAGTTYSWTATGSSPQVSGFTPGSGKKIQQTLDNAGYNTESVTYLVTPAANGCPGTMGSVVITVYPAPPVTFQICFDPSTTTNAKPVKLSGGIPLNGTYSGTGVVGSTFNPALSGAGTFTITYRNTNTYGCTKAATRNITVISPPAFTCGSGFTDVRDNRSYPTTRIGLQCWMAASLDYGVMIPGDTPQRDNCIPEKYCYNDAGSGCSTFGGLYQWDELMIYDNTQGIQGLCPPAWHIPSEPEWGTLFAWYISNGFAGSPLKSTGYSGYNAFVSGTDFFNRSWSFQDFAVMIWSSTSWGQWKAWAHGMNSFNPSVSYYPSFRANAFSVRCIKD
jgi:uncharacterized protein (TIGR02145 family)